MSETDILETMMLRASAGDVQSNQQRPQSPESTTRVPSLVVNVIKLTPREERAMARAVQLGVEAAVTGPQPFAGSRKVN